MDGAAPPLPYPTPPSIEEAVQQHVDVVTDIRDLKLSFASLSQDVARLANAQTVDRLTVGRLENAVRRLERAVVSVDKLTHTFADLVPALQKLVASMGNGHG